MKTILFISIFILVAQSRGIASDIFIEIGQDHIIKKSLTRVWVENSKIVVAESIPSGLKIKPISLGQTRIRLNDETFKVSVVPIGSLKSFQEWKHKSQKFIEMKVEYCEQLVCLKGKIFQISEFHKILKLLSEDPSPIYLALDIQHSLQNQIQNDLEKYQREKGLTPLKVNFTQPWRIQYGGKDFLSEYKTELGKIGILAVEGKQKIEIADNIKVSIQVTEVKKEFGRSLGIKYPGSYSAQVLEPESTKLIPFDISLNANEHEGDVKILASPNLVCRSGKEAEFFAGGEFPIRILNFKVNDVIWKKYGIGLKIKPVIDSAGQMSLQIDSEVSTLDESRTVDGIPGLQTNKVSSTFDLIRSRTIALSGLIKNEKGQSSEGLPFLRQIPILGRLFSSHDFRESRSELIIFVTPELLTSEESKP